MVNAKKWWHCEFLSYCGVFCGELRLQYCSTSLLQVLFSRLGKICNVECFYSVPTGSWLSGSGIVGDGDFLCFGAGQPGEGALRGAFILPAAFHFRPRR